MQPTDSLRRAFREAPTWLALTLALSMLVPARALASDDPWLARDKALHAGLSAALSAGGYALSTPWVRPRPARAACGVALSLSLGAAKELYDLAGHGTPSARDFTWDVLGALTGVGVAALIDFTWSKLRGRSAAAPSDSARRPPALAW
jgi:putative lipoprotein